ncbi:putative bifunctional diguanylate cyclase/phosphodiesterase [Maritalea porphyrae]|uniref:putative bifunctional diguanylate cyclase/phosphodiesterase n=1 Tax=Maritalea porphyrae TaxID=880732 RepID=UPI0022AF4B3C|nr:EAL domain-containing protein [Maritalea porphyrae]MCZ4271003.1 EAL domain-containing protein [Maritalea porphyrae]
MFGRLLKTIRSEQQLSTVIRAHLVDGLFHPFASLISGALAGIFIATILTLFVEDQLVVNLGYFVVFSAVARIIIGIIYLRSGSSVTVENVRQWEWAYTIGAGAFSAGLGVVTFFALTRIDNAPVHLMLCTTAAAYGASIAGRNAGRPWLALSQLYLATIPMGVGLMMQDTIFYHVVGFALILFMFGMTDITIAVRKTIIDALEHKQRNAELASSFKQQAERFDAALTNMSHGLCMFDQNQTLVVWNEKVADIIGAEQSLFEYGTTMEKVISAFHPDDHSKITTQKSSNGRGEWAETAKLSDGRFVSASTRTMENGNTVIVFADVTEKEKAEARIRNLAWVDQLTGLMNRVSVHEAFIQKLEQMDESSELAVHYIDLDHFKSVNDTLGHPIGDMLLKQVADRICDVCLDEGDVARMAGDEFLVLQKLSPQARSPRDLAQQIVAALHQPFNVNSHFIQIGASVGIVIAPKDGNDADLLLKRADMALYAAKKAGRNKFAYFEPQMDQRLQQMRALELDIKQALEKSQFKLAFQPIVNAENNSVASFECLVRWTHPTNGKMMPAKFIPAAEETGQIMEIGRWVTKEAIKTAAAWPVRTQISVNFSAVQFQDSRFADFLKRQLKRYNFPAELLELEITETAFIVDIENSLKQLQQLKDLGVKISLDDFGTGYSSLSQLQRFSFNKIKIDGSFVRDLETNPSSAAVATAVAEIGKALDITVVAECVETQAQLDFLKSVGVTHIQGYFTGRPMDAEAAEALLVKAAPAVSEAG